MRPRSTSAAGVASRSFIAGSRRGRRRAAARRSSSPRSSTASSTLAGRWYVNSAGRVRYIASSSSLIARQTRSGVSGMSMCAIPSGASASTTAFTTAGVEAIVPVSPAPFTPSGFTSVSVSVRSTSSDGKNSAFGTAYSIMLAVSSWPFSS